jgi:hypothetical protein
VLEFSVGDTNILRKSGPAALANADLLIGLQLDMKLCNLFVYYLKLGRVT